jgi:hypothetical protein
MQCTYSIFINVFMYCIVVFLYGYRNTTIQYMNTLINIEYVHYIQHGEVIPYRNTTIQYSIFINVFMYCIVVLLYGITSPCCM